MSASEEPEGYCHQPSELSNIKEEKEDDEPPKKKYAKNCCVCGPTNCALFRFPENEDRKTEWLTALNMIGDKRKDLRLCSSHFSKDSIIKNKIRSSVKWNTKPVLIERVSNIEEEKEDDDEPPKKKFARYCCICGPTNRPLFKFPENKDRKTEWLTTLNMLDDNRKDLKLCTSHFPKDSIMKNKFRSLLKSYAKPVIVERADMTDIGPTIPAAHSAIESPPRTYATVIEPGLSTSASTSHTPASVPISIENLRKTLRQVLNPERKETIDGGSTTSDTTDLSRPNTDLPRTMSYSMPVPGSPPSTSPETAFVANSVEKNCDTLPQFVNRERKTCEEMSTPKRSKSSFAQRRSIRYLGDINTPSLESPTTRRTCLCVIRSQRMTMGKRAKKLQQENQRLRMKIQNLKSLLSDLKKKNMITENAETMLMVNFIDGTVD